MFITLSVQSYIVEVWTIITNKGDNREWVTEWPSEWRISKFIAELRFKKLKDGFTIDPKTCRCRWRGWWRIGRALRLLPACPPILISLRHLFIIKRERKRYKGVKRAVFSPLSLISIYIYIYTYIYRDNNSILYIFKCMFIDLFKTFA